MRSGFVDFEREQLIKQIDFTLQQTKIIADCDALLKKVKQKPIGFFFLYHVLILMAIMFLVYLLSLVVTFPEVSNTVGLMIPFLYIAVYSTFIFVFNRVGIAIKHIRYDQELRQEPGRRRAAFDALEKYSEVPRDYWKFTYLVWMKSYLDKERAETMKECLNLVEKDIRKANLEGQLLEMEEHFRVHHTGHTVVYMDHEYAASSSYEETTYEETIYEETSYEGETTYEVDSTVGEVWDADGGDDVR
ncbi:MAG: hypothetical protein ACXVPK_09355 [Tumebacillaceae bacterium]